MKKLSIFLLAFIISFTLVGCTDPGEITTALDAYCDNNPDSTICTNPEAARDDIVANMFNTIMIEFATGTNETFCDDYFVHEGLVTKCNDDRFSLLPDDYGNLSSDITVNSIDGSDFEVITKYSDDTKAYTFNVSIVESEGIFKFSAFSYVDEGGENPDANDVDLELTNINVLEFMRDYLLMYDDATFNCSDYLTSDALVDCSIALDDVMGPLYLSRNPEIYSLGVNEFLYYAENLDGLEYIYYSISFVMIDDVLMADEIEYEIRGIYNDLDNVTAVLDEMISDYNDDYHAFWEVCESYFGDATVDECKEEFEPVKLDLISSRTIIKGATDYEITFTFDDDSNTTVTMNLNVITDAYGYYLFEGTVKDAPVITNPNEITVPQIILILEGLQADIRNGGFDTCTLLYGPAESYKTDCEVDPDALSNGIGALKYESSDVIRLSENKYEITGRLRTDLFRELYTIEFKNVDGVWMINDYQFTNEVTYHANDLTEYIEEYFNLYNTDDAFSYCEYSRIYGEAGAEACEIVQLTDILDGYHLRFISYENGINEDEIIVKYNKYDEDSLYVYTETYKLHPNFMYYLRFESLEQDIISYSYLNGTISNQIEDQFNAFYSQVLDEMYTDEMILDNLLKEGYSVSDFKSYRDDFVGSYTGGEVVSVVSQINSFEEIIYTVTIRLTMNDLSTVDVIHEGRVDILDDDIKIFNSDILYTVQSNNIELFLEEINSEVMIYEDPLLCTDIYSDSYLLTATCSGNESYDTLDLFKEFYFIGAVRLHSNTFLIKEHDGTSYVTNTVIEVIIEDGMIKINDIYPYTEYGETDISDAIDEFTTILNDVSISDEDFCMLYPLGDECEIIRTSIEVDGAATVVSIEEVEVNGELTQEVTYRIDLGEDQYKEFIVYVDIIEDGNDGITFGEVTAKEEGIDDDCDNVCDECAECPICEECPPCPGTSGIISSDVLLEAYYENLFIDYNDVLMTDSEFAIKYDYDMYEDFIVNRSSVLTSGGAILSKVNPILDSNNEFEATIVSYVTSTDGVSYLNELTEYVTLLAYNQYSAFIVSETKTVLPATTTIEGLMEEFIVDYLDVSMGNDVLSNKWFGIADHEIVNDRFTFLLSSGDLELITVSLDKGIYSYLYKEVIDGVEMVYEREISFDDTLTTLTISDRTLVDGDPVSIDMNDAYSIISNYYLDIINDTTVEEFHDKYYLGNLSAVPYYDFMKDNKDYIINSIKYVGDEVDDSLYEVRYYQISKFNVIEATYVYSVKINPDLTYYFELISFREKEAVNNYTPQLDTTYDELNYYVDDFFKLYGDYTISNEDYCTEHSIDYYCVMYREDYLSTTNDLDIVKVTLVDYYNSDDGIMYGIKLSLYGNRSNDPNYFNLHYESSLSIYFMSEEVTPKYNSSLYGYPYAYIPKIALDTFVLDTVSDFTDKSMSDFDFCDSLTSTEAGNDCFIHRASIADYNLVDYSYIVAKEIYAGQYSIRITIKMINPITDEVKFIDIPIDLSYSLGAITNTYYREFYLPEATNEELKALTDVYIVDYIDFSQTNAVVIQSYFPNMDESAISTFNLYRDSYIYYLSGNTNFTFIHVSYNDLTGIYRALYNFPEIDFSIEFNFTFSHRLEDGTPVFVPFGEE